MKKYEYYSQLFKDTQRFSRYTGTFFAALFTMVKN